MNIYHIEFTAEKGYSYNMPYYFTSIKDAVLYGEYKYRMCENIANYRIEKLETISRFYKLK